MTGDRKQRGFTLIEVLIYSGVLALFLLLTVQIFISVKLTNAHSLSLVSMNKNLHQIISDLGRTIKSADSVLSPAPGASAETLSLNDGAVLYQLSDGVLQKAKDGQVWDLTSDEVTVADLFFENVVEATQTSSIRVTMTVESNYLLEGGRRLSENLETCVSLR